MLELEPPFQGLYAPLNIKRFDGGLPAEGLCQAPPTSSPASCPAGGPYVSVPALHTRVVIRGVVAHDPGGWTKLMPVLDIEPR